MKHRERTLSIAVVCTLLSMLNMSAGYAAETAKTEETLDTYALPEVTVEADADKTPSQRNVLTSGDVTIIRREEIEQKHYTSIKEALLTIPGVTIEDPGYHAQAYEESSYASESIRINGDNRVLILINGRRMDVGVSSASGNSRSKANLALLTAMDNIERIEVVKGQGSLAYGSDATSVINIITRKGKEKAEGKVELAAGSWGQRVYKLMYSGTTNGWSYMLNASQTKGDDTKYRDYYLDKTVTYKNSKYDDRSFSFQLSHDFNTEQGLEINYSHMSNLDHFPISALDYKNPYIKGYSNQGSWYPGYRNMFKGDQDEGVYTETLANDFDATYTFMKDHGIPSYVTFYRNYHHYYEMDGSTWQPIDNEQSTGLLLQYGRQLRKKDVFLTGFEIKRGDYYYNSGPDDYDQNWVRRTDLGVYAQDKIAVSDKFTVTPGLRFSHYGSVNYRSNSGTDIDYNGYNRFTGAINANYSPVKNMDIYASWSQLFNVPYSADFRKNSSIQPEHGDIYTVGVKYKFNEKTDASVGYTYSDVRDAIIRYSYLNPAYDASTMRASKKWINKAINLDQSKKGLNLAVSHRFNKDWSMLLSYTYTNTTQSDAVNQDNPYEDENYKRVYPQNVYKMTMGYAHGKWNVGLDSILYAGCDTKYFSSSRFLVFNATINYYFTKDTNLYLKIMNLTNQTYETRASSWGIGSFPQPGRNFVIGCDWRF